MKVSKLALMAALLPALGVQGSPQSDVERQASVLSQELLKRHTGWTKISTKGASIRTEEVFRSGTSGKDLVVKYHLFVTGLPSDKLYESLNWPINQRQPQSTLQGISIGKDGIVMCAGRSPEQCGNPAKKDDPIEFTLMPGKAEPYRIAIVATDTPDQRVAITIVPDPIMNNDKGCSLTVTRLMPHFELAYFNGTGFPANSDVQFDTQSFEEKHTASAKSDENGNLSFALMPFVAGHNAGTTHVRALGNCSPAISFDWGK